MKKVLFVIESLGCGGAEKSLITLLRLLNYSEYEVDLQLFSHDGEFEIFLPKEVHILPLPTYFVKTGKPLYQAFLTLKSIEDARILVSRIRYSFFLRMGNHSNPDKAVTFWRFAGSCFNCEKKKYDIAIAYSQNVPTFYVADCVDAVKKYAWVNNEICSLNLKNRNYMSSEYKKIDKIVGVSESAERRVLELFPNVKEKTMVIYDINDGRLIESLAKLNSERAQSEMKHGRIKILTVGRLVPQKGYDIAIDACAILKEKNIDFCWYVIGGGALEGEIRELIKEKHLEDCFIILGVKANPYPYFMQSQLYVQTSRYEGFGIAIAEARILNIPVVTTRFSAVYAQMIEGENGIVVDMNAEAVAEGIQRLIEDTDLYEHIKSYQMTEKKTNYEELEKIYKMIDGDILTG